MTTTPMPPVRTLAAAIGLGTILLASTGCSALAVPTGAEYDKSASYEFTDVHDSTAQQVLPSWVPDGATNIKEEQRTTGHERIIAMDVAEGPAPSTCTPLKTAGHPSATEIERGLVQGGSTRTEAREAAAAQHTTALLHADWWPAGQEDQSTHLCGKWWISVQDGTLYAYTPETQVVADGVENDRSQEK